MEDEGLRFAAFDIEATGLNATYGRLLCACFKFTDEDFVWEIDAASYEEEPDALEEIARLWNAADVVMTWNGKRYDIPFINGRLMTRRDEIDCDVVLDPRRMHIDLLYQSRKMRFASHRMESAGKQTGIITGKHDLPGEYWVKAADGDRRCQQEILKHCYNDVLMTEELFETLKPHLVRITR